MMQLTTYETTIMDSRSTPIDLPLEYELFLGEIVPLEETDFLQAQQIGQRYGRSTATVQQRWAIYLHALALKAFQQWFNQRTTPVPLDVSRATILLSDGFEAQPFSVKGYIAVCQIRVAPFKICLVVTDGSADDWCLPTVAMQSPRFAAHFYVPIVVHEASGQAEILGFLRHDQLPTVGSESGAESAYCRVEISQVNPDLERLLLNLTCLEQSAIPLPSLASNLATALPQRLSQLLIQPAIQTRQWLNQQINTVADQVEDAIATELAAWQVLPALELAIATRSGLRDVAADSPMGDLSAILISLMRDGVSIPSQPATAYQDFQLGDLALRLYAVTGAQTSEAAAVAEWSLLIILRHQNRADLPRGVNLQIADADAVLVDRRTETSQSDFLYGMVIGEMDEQFTVELGYQDQNLTLPPFIFA